MGTGDLRRTIYNKPAIYYILSHFLLADVRDIYVRTYYNMSETLIPIIRNAMKQKTSDEWMRLFRENDLVIGRLPNMKDVLGEQTDEVLKSYGYDNAAIAHMHQIGAVQ